MKCFDVLVTTSGVRRRVTWCLSELTEWLRRLDASVSSEEGRVNSINFEKWRGTLPRSLRTATGAVGTRHRPSFRRPCPLKIYGIPESLDHQSPLNNGAP